MTEEILTVELRLAADHHSRTDVAHTATVLTPGYFVRVTYVPLRAMNPVRDQNDHSNKDSWNAVRIATCPF
jgi:hypothetical protein